MWAIVSIFSIMACVILLASPFAATASSVFAITRYLVPDAVVIISTFLFTLGSMLSSLYYHIVMGKKPKKLEVYEKTHPTRAQVFFRRIKSKFKKSSDKIEEKSTNSSKPENTGDGSDVITPIIPKYVIFRKYKHDTHSDGTKCKTPVHEIYELNDKGTLVPYHATQQDDGIFACIFEIDTHCRS